jgi:hypothetical protein
LRIHGWHVPQWTLMLGRLVSLLSTKSLLPSVGASHFDVCIHLEVRKDLVRLLDAGEAEAGGRNTEVSQ